MHSAIFSEPRLHGGDDVTAGGRVRAEEVCPEGDSVRRGREADEEGRGHVTRCQVT